MNAPSFHLTVARPENAKFMGAVDKVVDLLAGPLRADLYAEARRLIVEFGRAAA
jgi:hypothetical protein